MIRAFASVPGPAARAPEPGLGVLCREAQADGVPCDDVAAYCYECERRRRLSAPQPPTVNGSPKRHG